MVSEVQMNPTEKYVTDLCKFLGLDEEKFTQALKELRDKGWQRWGGGTVEVTVAEILYVVTRLRNPEQIFEGGTNWGYSTAHLAEALKDNGKNPSLCLATVDIDEPTINEAISYLWEKDIEVTPMKIDSVEWLKKVDGNGEYTPELDLVFIDTAHTYEHTVKEWEAMKPLLKEGAAVFFHDAYTDAYGVKQFLKEVEATGQWKVLILDTQPNTGLGVVVKNV